MAIPVKVTRCVYLPNSGFAYLPVGVNHAVPLCALIIDNDVIKICNEYVTMCDSEDKETCAYFARVCLKHKNCPKKLPERFVRYLCFQSELLASKGLKLRC